MKTPTNWAVYILENENQALSEIYDEHRSAFLGWVQKSSNCSRDEALELFQTSIVILYENVISGKLTKLDNVKSYLFTIGKNKMMEHFRKLKKTQHVEIKDNLLKSAITEEFEMEDENEDVFKISDALLQLGDPCKTLLENFYFRKMSLDEIAQEMDYKNTDTVKTKKFKCIQRLRKMYA